MLCCIYLSQIFVLQYSKERRNVVYQTLLEVYLAFRRRLSRVKRIDSFRKRGDIMD